MGNIEDNLPDSKKRDMLITTGQVMFGIGCAAFVVPLLSSFGPAADVLALSSVEVDVSSIEPGQTVKVKWQGKPVFIRHRTQHEIEKEDTVQLSSLKDPEADIDRTAPGKREWLVVLGICTHLGCVPESDRGAFGGWFCPCHGSDYDGSGRIRKGPAPRNLEIPKYTFISDSVIKIG